MTRSLTYLVVGLSFLIAFSTLRAFPLGLSIGFEAMLPHIDLRPVAFIAHIAGASIALFTGGIQLLDWVRKHHLNWHRWNGRVYVVAVLCGGVSGFWLALSALGGSTAMVGFALLAVLWCITTILGLVNARAGNIKAHRAWMYRSFALTFAAVTLRIQLAVFIFSGWEYADASVWLAWISWVPNLIWMEWKLRRAN